MKYNATKNYEYIKSRIPRDRLEQFLEEHDKQIIKEFVNEVDKYICTHHAKCEDCDFTYKTCFECFYHNVWLKENK